jgi:hypothetical protein
VLSLIRRKLQPFARLTNLQEANKIGAPCGRAPLDQCRRQTCVATILACHNGKMIFDGKPSLGPCSTNFFPVKKEMADGLSVLFDTGDI